MTFLLDFTLILNTGGAKTLDGAMSHDRCPQETDGYSVLATVTEGWGGTTLYQNGLQTMDMGG